MKKINFSTKKFNFAEIIESYFSNDGNCFSLNLIHFLKDETGKCLGDSEVFTRDKDQSTFFHKKFYELAKLDSFNCLYINFIKSIIRPLYSESIIYQKIPTFRIHMPNNIAVGEFHKDKQYRDIKWAEYVHEDNFFLPFTNAFDTNTIWVESEEDKGDFSPMICNYGEIIQWDGCNLTHGNKLNTTKYTRVSVDFRVIKKSNYIPSESTSINTKTQFKIGGYYDYCD
jgi:hypothetical protein